MGGDGGTRSSANQMVLLCVLRHQGAESLHSGDLRIEPLTGLGTSGPCEFWRWQRHWCWEVVATEKR